MIREGIAKLIDHKNLTRQEAETIMTEIMSGDSSEAQIAAFITALRMKGETIDEVVAFASIMRRFSHQIHPKVDGILVDTCGTGGDRLKTFNISTIAAFVAAGAEIPIAKHGNRSVSSLCGSADVLETLGINLKMTPAQVERSIEEIGIGFMFAPVFHPAMKHAVTPRREIGIRTIFNLLGPLTNPAHAQAQLLGVYDGSLTEPLAHVLSKLEVDRALVVHGIDGLDEISTVGKTKITQVTDGEITTSYFSPQDFGIKTGDVSQLTGSTPEESAEIMLQILSGKTRLSNTEDPQRDIVLVNAAAAIQLGGKAETLQEGMDVARNSIRGGAAYDKLKELIKFSHGDLLKLEEYENRG
jgi:anthranilate phosphoribosyltransferase